MFSFFSDILLSSWMLLNQSAFYVLLGLLIGGMLKTCLPAASVAAHLGEGRLSSVLKAALIGIPLPLCSCGVLPAAAALKKQGASNGAVTAFLIATPESGADSIALSWALLDPVMTVARPLSAFLSAVAAGLAENLFSSSEPKQLPPLRLASASGVQSSFREKLAAGCRYAAEELWADLAGWFFLGILVAGIITALVPDDLTAAWLGGGLSSMLLMLLVGIPLYICASASTPIAAALILKGVSPGTALVFLLTGPATNIASLTVLTGLLGKRAVALYLLSIAAVSVLCGMAVDAVYLGLGISAAATIGSGGEMLPEWLMRCSSLTLFVFSIRPLRTIFNRWFGRKNEGRCGCSRQQ